MEFQRARSDEQKEIRIQQISKAALGLFNEQKYDDITLAGIANNLSFTRANLYKYISSKEEIFLYVILEELKKWKEDVLLEYESLGKLDKKEFSVRWAEIIYDHKTLIETLSLLYTIIEKNVTVEKLTEFKKSLFYETEELVGIIIRIFPYMTQEAAFEFLQLQLFFATGLYPATNECENQKKALKAAGIPYITPDFVKTFADFILMEFCKFDV